MGCFEVDLACTTRSLRSKVEASPMRVQRSVLWSAIVFILGALIGIWIAISLVRIK